MNNSLKDGRPLIVSGMFRSGTSLIWRILTNDPEYINFYYEPLHEDLIKYCKKNKEKIWNIYRNDKELLKKWSENFNIKGLHLSIKDDYPELNEYFKIFIKNKALIKFTRMNMRLGWLINNYPSVFVINIVRDPRSVCYSIIDRGWLNFQVEGILKTLRKDIDNAIKNKDYASIPYKLLKRNFHGMLGKFDTPSAYWYKEYFNRLRNVDAWKKYISDLPDEKPQIKIMALWKMNVEQSMKDLESFKKNSIIIKHEDFCLNYEKTLTNIYKNMNREVPEKLLSSFKDKSSQESFKIKHHKFHMNITDKWIERWREFDDDFWMDALEKTKCISLMKKLNYEI